jgi:hypothetical protein
MVLIPNTITIKQNDDGQGHFDSTEVHIKAHWEADLNTWVDIFRRVLLGAGFDQESVNEVFPEEE